MALSARSSSRLVGPSVVYVDGRPSGVSVFMCGPASMVSALQGGLRAAGVPAGRIHREYFDWR